MRGTGGAPFFPDALALWKGGSNHAGLRLGSLVRQLNPDDLPNGNPSAALQQQATLHRINPLQPPLGGDVCAALLFLVRQEVGHLHQGMFPLLGIQVVQPPLQLFPVALSQLHTLVCQAARLPDDSIKACQGRKGRELSRPLRHGHPRMLLGGGMGQVDDVVIGVI